MIDPRKIFSPFSGFYPLKSLIKSSNQFLIFPFYHAVSDSPPAHLRNLYRIKSTQEFEKDIDLLLKNFKAVSPEILINQERPIQLDKASFILSFDDGLREVKETIVPILNRKGITAIFFLNNNFIGNKSLFFRYKISVLIEHLRQKDLKATEKNTLAELLKTNISDMRDIERNLLLLGFSDIDIINNISTKINFDYDSYLSNNQPYLNEDEILELKNEGYFIGSHSFDHLDFSELSEANQSKEIIESTADIRRRFELEYSFFAFPFSDIGVSKGTLENLHRMPDGPDASFGTSGLRKSMGIPHYQRIAMEKTSDDALRIVKTENFYFFLKKLLQYG
ncbi:MAG: polysaccharide deacetylase family protein [Bacteroidales bacterium]|nr:polysaccharide deacetylase family protein [Bacteroidales bacterium]